MTPKQLADRFVAPCCWRESLATHQSPEAEKLRGEIARRLEAGEDAAGIEADLVRRHGPRIRRVPEGEAGTWLFALPWAALGLGAVAVGTYLRRQQVAAARDE